MLSNKILRLFCSNDEKRKNINVPFNIGDFTYATDGCIAVRIFRQEEYAANEPTLCIVDIFDKAFKRFSDVSLVPLPNNFKEEYVKCKKCDSGIWRVCPDCGGKGMVEFVSDCGYEYEFDCKMCNEVDESWEGEKCPYCFGTGKIVNPSGLEIGGKFLNVQLLLKLRKNLIDVFFAPSAVPPLSPVPFKFNGGTGVIMEMRI